MSSRPTSVELAEYEAQADAWFRENTPMTPASCCR